MPTLNDVRAFLTQRSAKFDEKSIPHGVSFRCAGGEVFNWYEKKGNVTIQGTPTSLATQVKSWTESGTLPSQPPVSATESAGLMPQPSILPGLCKDVFVVYGHDDQALKDLELILRKMDLRPIILARLPG